MKNLLLIVVFAVSAICASAQKVYFIYLQSDSYNPFYVKMNDKIYSSANSGYLILSNLVDSTYTFSIGFPSLKSESKFIISLGGKDKGFLIKNFDFGIGLFDLQNLNITHPQKDDSPKNISYTRRNDEFSSLLSRAARDTSLLYAVVRIKGDDMAIQKESTAEEPKQKTEQPFLPKDTIATNLQQSLVVAETKNKDTASSVQSDSDIVNALAKGEIKKDTVSAMESEEQPVQTLTGAAIAKGSDTLTTYTDTRVLGMNSTKEAVFKKSTIKKYSESSTSEGFGLVYYDIHDGEQDTIRLLIPNPPIIFRQATEQDSSLAQKDFIHIDELKKDTVQQTPIVVAVKKGVLVKSQCKSIALNNDFFKLRKNMASETTDEGMVTEAKKIFKSKCFSTEQIKNLSALFLTSAGKYQFFDAAYLHVSDQENFSSLESEIKDDYYLKRFKALIGD